MDYKNPVCRGSWVLGTACGKCERCRENKGQAMAEALILENSFAPQVAPPAQVTMKEIWEYVEDTARTDPAYYQVVRAYRAGAGSQEKAVLVLLKFLREQRDNRFKSALECAMNHPQPITWRAPEVKK